MTLSHGSLLGHRWQDASVTKTAQLAGVSVGTSVTSACRSIGTVQATILDPYSEAGSSLLRCVGPTCLLRGKSM